MARQDLPLVGGYGPSVFTSGGGQRRRLTGFARPNPVAAGNEDPLHPGARFVGMSMAQRMKPALGGETYEMNSVAPDSTGRQSFFAGPREWHAGFEGGGHHGGGDDGRIHGYVGSGVPTDVFSKLYGRGPTAADAEQLNGVDQFGFHSLSPDFGKMGMGSLDALYAMNQPRSRASSPVADPDAWMGLGGRPPPDFADQFKDAPPIEGRADGGPVAAGQPVVVGESGPEVVVPQADATVIPNGRDMARRAALRKGDIDSYIKLLWRY